MSIKGATAVAPVIWAFYGYQFEAAPMIVGLMACLIVRLYIGFKNHTRSAVMIDIVVTALTLLFSGVLIMTRRPDPFTALIMGTGMGAFGAGIIVQALLWLKKTGFVLPEDKSDATPKRIIPIQNDDDAAIFDAIEKLKSGK